MLRRGTPRLFSGVMRARSLPSRISLLSLVLTVASSASAQKITPLPAGILAESPSAEIQSAESSGTPQGPKLEVLALRDDVLRIRMWRGAQTPEDASWAVLSEARGSRGTVRPDKGGFRTSKLRVAVDADLKLSVYDLAGHLIQSDAAPVSWQGNSFRLHKTRTPEDSFFGLGDKPGPLDRGGQAFTMWNTDNFGWQESTDPIYKSIPFFIDFKNGEALGVLVDNTWRSFFDFGQEDPKQISFGAANGPIDYYLIWGPDPKAVVSTYAWLTGPTPLPPMWALGFQQSRYSYFPESQLTGVADRLRADKIPADALYLDIDFQDRNRPFTVDTANYPDFRGLVKKLGQQEFHLVVITDLHIARLPDSGYAPYDSGVAGDQFVKNPDGSTFVGDVWPGPSVFPDFTQASSRVWWGTLYKTFVADGVAGFWNDMNEPAVFNVSSKTMPDTVQHRIDEPGFAKRTAPHTEIHNVFGMENSRATYEGLLTLRPDERPFVLTRASYAGGQRYAATWTGDNSSTWNHLRMTVPQLANLGLSGFSLSGADVGGFAGSPSPQLLTKWLEYSAFQPIDRDHAAKGTRPHEVWVDGPEQEATRKRYIEERYRLMPYLYTLAEETSRDGIPMMRPMFLEFPQAGSHGRAMDLDTGGGEFMVGGDLLVAPAPSPEEIAPYEVHLPPGTWYDYWTGERFDRVQAQQDVDLEQRDKVLAQKKLMITPTLETLPVYARGGSILPSAPLVQSTEETPAGPLRLRVYAPGDANTKCAGEVYADDGHTFAFRKGEFARVAFTCHLTAGGALEVSALPQEGRYKPWWSAYQIEVTGWKPVSGKATSNGRPLHIMQGTAPGVVATVMVPATREGFRLELK